MYEIIETIILCITAFMPGILWGIQDDLKLKIMKWAGEI